MNATKDGLEPPHLIGSRVGAGRPLVDRPYPPLRTSACTFPRTRLSPSPGYWLNQLSGQHQHIPHSFSAFSQVPLVCFLPNRDGFTTVACAYPSVGTAPAVCTSYYSRTSSNTRPPSSCRCYPVEMIPHFRQKGDAACSRSSVRPSSLGVRVCQKSWREGQRCKTTLSSGPAFQPSFAGVRTQARGTGIEPV